PRTRATHHAEADRERRDDEEGDEGKEGGIAQTVPNEGVYLRPPAVRIAEVTLQQSLPFAVVVGAYSEPFEVAREERSIQPMRYAILLELIWSRVLPESAYRLIARGE